LFKNFHQAAYKVKLIGKFEGRFISEKYQTR